MPSGNESEHARLRVVLTGRVQGVGFRDRVLEIARSYSLAGSVRNLSAGNALEIDLEGEVAEIEACLAQILANPPRYARIEGVKREPAAPRGATGFSRESTV